MPTPPPEKLPTTMQALARYIERSSDESLTLKALAKITGLSPGHLQRRFKAEIGISPRQYQEACRLKKLKETLRAQAPLSDAIYAAGFGSPSRIYERNDSHLGMTPGQYRSGGRELGISYATETCTLGKVLIAATDRGVCFLQFGESTQALIEALQSEFPQARIVPMPETARALFRQWMQALHAYLKAESRHLTLPLDIRGTAFQVKVWTFLQTIPPGKTCTYSEVAQALQQPKAVRVIASACGRNRIAIAIPCHRVIRGDGTLAGYRWGVERKEQLLKLEKTAPD